MNTEYLTNDPWSVKCAVYNVIGGNRCYFLFCKSPGYYSLPSLPVFPLLHPSQPWVVFSDTGYDLYSPEYCRWLPTELQFSLSTPHPSFSFILSVSLSFSLLFNLNLSLLNSPLQYSALWTPATMVSLVTQLWVSNSEYLLSSIFAFPPNPDASSQCPGNTIKAVTQ